MKSYKVDLEQVLNARERRAGIQNRMLSGAGQGQCLVCLTMNIAGEVKRTPMTRMLFDHGMSELESLGYRVIEKHVIDEVTGSEAFWLVDEEGTCVKQQLQDVEDSFPAARLFDFDVLTPDGSKLSRWISRRCLICDAPAAECARSRRHGLDAIKSATDELLRSFCADELADAAYKSLLDELYTTPKPGLVDLMSNGAHKDMDVPLFEKSASSLIPYFRDTALLGMEHCDMAKLRARGIEAERGMFKATGGVNTHKGAIYSLGLLVAGMGACLADHDQCSVGTCIEHAAALAREDAEAQLRLSKEDPDTNGGMVYCRYGVKGATGEAAAGFPDAVYCCSRLAHYRAAGCENPEALAFCDSMAKLDDTNLLHRGGPEGLAFARDAAARIAALPVDRRIEALKELDPEMIARNLSPGGSADMLAIAFLLERWQKMSQDLYL